MPALAFLERIRDHETLAVVGHEPLLGGLLLQATQREMTFLEAEVVVLERRGAGWDQLADLTYSDRLINRRNAARSAPHTLPEKDQ
jgi:phosphohistidine phosphatase SixA